MPHITVLRKEISELIAAGEVIERPASVIKELVENAIDAGAEHITIEIKNGGITYMRIADDGCGMAAEEVPTAFLRHATSKISEKDDLDSIFTLGFRGEALASVAAVSKVTILTKRRKDALGTHYVIEGGVETEQPEQTGCPDGTTLIIRDLFYNVPVRQKFMKRDVTEANAVSQIVQKIALSHPEIAFRMIRDNRMEFRTDGGGDLYTTMYAIMGKEFAHDMIPVSYSDGLFQINGYVGKPLYARSSRSFQIFFVNGRYVRSKACSVALENAYQNLIMTGKFPTCVLMVSMPPAQLDVNIHPAKAEVRFANETAVMDCIFFAVKNALLQNGLIYEFEMERVPQRDWIGSDEKTEPFVQPELPQIEAPKTELSMETAAVEIVPAVSQPCKEMAPSVTVEPFTDSQHMEKSIVPTHMENEEETYHFVTERAYIRHETEESLAETRADVRTEEKKKIHVIGEIFQNYILGELDEQLLIFDKHAAHERVIFERLKSGASKQTSQMLLQETMTLLPMDEFSAVQENLSRLDEMGFVFDCSTPPQLKTKAVPSFVLEMNIDEVVAEIAQNLYLGKKDPQTHTFHDMLHNIACKSAVRSGDHNSLMELQKLAQEVWENENIRHCPHGRPVMFVLRKYDLEKQFRRRV